MGTLSCGHSLPIDRHLVCDFFIKPLIVMSIFINIHRPYVCDLLGPCFSLVNNILLVNLNYLFTSTYRLINQGSI